MILASERTWRCVDNVLRLELIDMFWLKQGRSGLFYAATTGLIKTIRLLLDKNVLTTLHWAAQGDKIIREYLVEAQAHTWPRLQMVGHLSLWQLTTTGPRC